MKKTLLTLFLTVIFFAGFSQDNYSATINGEWTISAIKIVSLSPENDINESNCFWGNVKSTGKPLIFREDKTFSFFMFDDMNGDPSNVMELQKYGRYEISGNEMKIFFTGEASLTGAEESKKSIVESYTSYSYSLIGNRLVLKNQDSFISEQYTFTKK
jgi:hypothetical protein